MNDETKDRQEKACEDRTPGVGMFKTTGDTVRDSRSQKIEIAVNPAILPYEIFNAKKKTDRESKYVSQPKTKVFFL
jgi:hypothetical protein